MMTDNSEFHAYLEEWRLRKETHERRFMRILNDIRKTLIDMQFVVPLALAYMPGVDGERLVEDLTKQSTEFEELAESVQDYGIDMVDLLGAVRRIMLKQNEPPTSSN